jgi:hypothetical protein
MEERKYAKYIVTKVTPPKGGLPVPRRIEEQRQAGNYLESTWLFNLDDSVTKGGLYTSCLWLWDKKGSQPLQVEIAHTHDFNEVLGFVGTVKGDPRALGGEIEFWLEDEKYIIDKSCLIFVPKGMKHLPLYFNRIDTPIFWWTAGDGTMYGRTSGNEV